MDLTRREFVGGGALALATGSAALARSSTPFATDSDEHNPADFTFVHLTDMHVTPKRRGDQGYRACIESVRDLEPRPALALMGGDLAFDGLYNPKADFDEQIRLYREISDGLGIPHYPCIGNHDVLGWSSRRKCPADDPELGKRMIMDRLQWQWERPYYSFDHGGWHFAVLDSIHPKQFDHGPGYEPRIGREQLEWLAYDLGAAGDRPKVVMTHIAAFCNRGQLGGDPHRKAMDGNMVLWDTAALRDVLERHSVKALLQGHSHDVEEYRYNDVWYITSAAVSGAWWAGSWTGSLPGYTVFRCHSDELTWTCRQFAWTEHLEPEDVLERRKIAEQQAAARERAEKLSRERSGAPTPG